MVVYRLEINNYGVFCGESQIDMNFPGDAYYNDFGYTCDRQYQHKSEYRSACQSIDKLIEYFGSDFSYALERGAELVQYVVHKAHVRFGLFDNIEDSIEVVFNSEKIKDRTVILKGVDEWQTIA